MDHFFCHSDKINSKISPILSHYRLLWHKWIHIHISCPCVLIPPNTPYPVCLTATQPCIHIYRISWTWNVRYISTVHLVLENLPTTNSQLSTFNSYDLKWDEGHTRVAINVQLGYHQVWWCSQHYQYKYQTVWVKIQTGFNTTFLYICRD